MKIERQERRRLLLLCTVVAIAMAGLAYQLIAGTMATYLIGQSVTQFSFATGWFMASMGLGSYLSKFARRNLFSTLVYLQITLAIIGGFSSTIMFLAFSLTDTLYPFFIMLALVIGGSIGFEIPVIVRILNQYRVLRTTVADVFTWDYIGALVISLVFPLLILPYLGLIRSAIFFGMLNLTAAFLVFLLHSEKSRYLQKIMLITTLLILVAGFIWAETLNRFIEENLYQDPIVLTKETPYQRLVVTKWKGDTRLYINGNIQFSSRDEFRYHETLVHTPIAFMKQNPRKVVILGGGDGMVARELLKYPSIEEIILVDLDPEMVELFKTHHFLSKLNEFALRSSKVKFVFNDAFVWLKENHGREKYDLIIADLPDPNSYSLGKLYSVSFYLFVLRSLESNGVFVTQATSPTFAPRVFWSILATLKDANRRLAKTKYEIRPFHAYLPSFGDWGFIMTGELVTQPRPLPRENLLKYLNKDLLQSHFSFSRDILKHQNNEINKLNQPVLVDTYARSYYNWYQ